MMYMSPPIKSFNKVTNYLILTLLLMCNVAYAETSLLITDAFNVKSINGQAVSGNLLQNNIKIPLKPGINHIALEYEVVFESDDDDNFDIIKSNIFIIKFYSQIATNYRLQYLKPSTAKAARKYINNPLITVVDHLGKPIKVTQFFPSSQNISFIHQMTQEKVIHQPSIQIVTEPTDLEQPDVEKMLLYWWLKADNKQRKAFLDKVKE